MKGAHPKARFSNHSLHTDFVYRLLRVEIDYAGLDEEHKYYPETLCSITTNVTT
jgi:hypothetical protein